jgi:hypothetical protein
MKYLVTYRLLHPAYLPSTHTREIEAHSHAEFEERLVILLTRWRTVGYTVRVLHILPARPKRLC